MLSFVEGERDVVSPGNQNRKAEKEEFTGKSVVALEINPERLVTCGRKLCSNVQVGVNTTFFCVALFLMTSF